MFERPGSEGVAASMSIVLGSQDLRGTATDTSMMFKDMPMDSGGLLTGEPLNLRGTATDMSMTLIGLL